MSQGGLTLTASETLISGYGNGGFTIGGKKMEGSVLLAEGVASPWNIDSIDELTGGSLAFFKELADRIEVLLIGSGAQAAFIAPAIRAEFKALGIIIDAMDTGAACRTYNILSAESRLVAAALIAV